MVQISGWLQNVPYRIPLLHETFRFDVRRHVVTSWDFNKKIGKNVFPQIVKVKGQTQGHGQIMVSGQGHFPL